MSLTFDADLVQKDEKQRFSWENFSQHSLWTSEIFSNNGRSGGGSTAANELGPKAPKKKKKPTNNTNGTVLFAILGTYGYSFIMALSCTWSFALNTATRLHLDRETVTYYFTFKTLSPLDMSSKLAFKTMDVSRDHVMLAISFNSKLNLWEEVFNYRFTFTKGIAVKKHADQFSFLRSYVA